ncbi:MAG TPA: DUF481 domain-containing protein [Opitutaceae bacterium]|nr:DUF481 domain-containing protein [Opitutaceae bacterium]
MFSLPSLVRPWIAFLLLFLSAVLMVRAQPREDTTDATRDTLVYKDGDRVHGHLVTNTGTVIVFKSDRFGELRVPVGDAVVIKAEKPASAVKKEVVAEGIKKPSAAKVREEEEKVSIWERYSPALLTAKVRDFFGPWTGRLSFSNDIVTDTAHRDNIAAEVKLARKYTKDAFEFDARYDYDQINGTATTDVVKGIGSWRHDFNPTYFSQYRPTFEWNRASLLNGQPNQYELLQQEIGAGVNIWATPVRTLRLGVSENLFDVWNSSPTPDHSSRAVASLFDEITFTLPWRMTLTQRGVWYPESKRHRGYEDQIELDKKLTETLSVSIRHEIRRDNPDGSSLDYSRLKLLLGLDF